TTTDGSIRPGGVQGYYVADTRLLSMWRLSIDGEMPRVLTTHQGGAALRITGATGDPTTPNLLVVQELQLSDELMLTVDIENLTSDPRSVSVELAVNADFADLFDVKRGVPPRGGLVTYGALDDDLIFRYQNESFRRGIRIHIDEPDVVLRDGIGITQHLAPHARVTVHATATPVLAQRERPAGSARLHQQWLSGRPTVAPVSVPDRIWSRSWDDLGTLMMVDPIDAERTIVAAGSPWFMALFGRDSLITSWETLSYRSDLALGVLDALAARQGTRTDATTLEQPGRIPHEARRGEAVQRTGGWGSTFYGTVDATPLFVMTLARAWRCGAPDERVKALLPAARAAVDWLVGDGDLDGDGFVEYPGVVTGASGLANQGWKDSFDAIRHADGSLAAGPIALVEVQGYCHAAFVAIADLYEHFGGDDPAPWRERAAKLAVAIDEQFWIDELDSYALALDGDKRTVATVTTNAGHLLFTGTAQPERAARLSRRLMQRDMFTGFG
ncbi:MAG TPA: glycogen debranching N-terminal domain-containing protein, partial [Ilumatobacteraceae bacterium]|nr:glycogen debranching N-terminal domain-containing protein [Ilumatobacteraceae bacterium]